ncbi:MAG: hypothetical protein GX974_09310 [Clostridiales bacterium]|nr:hypothetical protein [Clostridiales bacterium]
MSKPKRLKARLYIYNILCIILFSVLIFRLLDLTVKKGEAYYAMSQERKTVELTLQGTRGKILDRNGVPMATNRQIYVLQLDNRSLPATSKQKNEMLAKLVPLIERYGDNVVDNLPIKYKKGIGLYYNWGSDDPKVRANRYERWAKDVGIKSADPLNAKEAFNYLKKQFSIDDDIDVELARKIISFRVDIFLNRYKEYAPIRVAEDVNEKTVALVETFAPELPGVHSVMETSRYYPMGETAAHIIGYVGRIPQERADLYKEKGYDISKDMIGISGIEAAYEDRLTGNVKEKQGRLLAEINSSGRIIKVLDEELAEDGNDVVLTLDSRLQKSAEHILKTQIYNMSQGLPPYDGEKDIAPLANSGAAVVLDVNTSEILALVSYPSYDLNLFSGGIKSSDYEQLNEDPAKPLYPLAFKGGMTPGSVFKMLVAVAGLEENEITLEETILDEVYYTKYNKKNPPSCANKRGHGEEDVIDAIKHSCNYFFFELSDRLGIDRINKWADLFGLTAPTGLEILLPNEDYNIVANEKVKRQRERYNLRQELIQEVMNKYGYFKDISTDEQRQERDECIERLADYEITYDYILDTKGIQRLLDDMGYFKFEDSDNDGYDDLSGRSEQGRLYDKINASYEIRGILIKYKRWIEADTIITGIGQSYTLVSPLGMARYIAALANGGKVMTTHIVRDTKPQILNVLDIDPEHMKAIHEGMHKVVYETGGRGGGGTAAKYFTDLDPKITLAGKTGTAQTTDKSNEEKNNAWFVAFTPYEKPEIAVVVAIPNGRTAGNAAPIARQIIEEYYRLKDETHERDVGNIYELQR